MISLIFLVSAFTIVVGLTVLERRRNPARTDWWRNIQAWLLDMSVGLTVIEVWPDWHGGSLINGQDLPVWAAALIFLITRDFVEFAYHYAQHKVPVLWAMHSLHHSDPEMSALTTNRHFWGDQLIKALTIWSFAAMVMSPTHAALGVFSVVSFYHYFSHANLRVDFGRWSWVLNSPAYHRHHHSREAAHFDTNFAALFPIFDVIFGTYRRPSGWPATGLELRPQSFADLVVWPLRWARHHAETLPAVPAPPAEPEAADQSAQSAPLLASTPDNVRKVA